MDKVLEEPTKYENRLATQMIKYCEEEIDKRNDIIARSNPNCNANSLKANHQREILLDILHRLNIGMGKEAKRFKRRNGR